jgi:hypothetical protein
MITPSLLVTGVFLNDAQQQSSFTGVLYARDVPKSRRVQTMADTRTFQRWRVNATDWYETVPGLL